MQPVESGGTPLIECEFLFFLFVVLELEVTSLHMLDKHSACELHPQPKD